MLGGLSFSWGPLDSSPFLPRVTYGRTVLARALWWMTEAEIKELTKKSTPPERWAAVQAWRAKRRLPRLVALMDADNELLVDLDNVLSIDTFLDVVEGRDRARLTEVFPGPDELLATGPEGRFVHEILVPFNRRPPEAKPETARPERRSVAISPVERSFPPGSEWLYAKLYTGTSTADRVLTEAVAPVVREALAQGLVDGWFFIRYSDPDWHLRVRFHGAPAALEGELLPRLHRAVEPMLADGRIYRMQLDTYGREIERYGGPVGILLCERIFEIDSEAVLAIVEMLEGDAGADARWRLALRGTEDLLSALCPDPAAKQRVLVRMRQSFASEFGGGKGLRIQLDRKYRQENRALTPLLTAERDAESELEPGLAVIRQRNERLAPMIAELFAAEQEGHLTVDVADLASSLVHMHVNRMIRSTARAHELVLYDLLGQLLESRAARERKKSPPSVPP
jgi:thiopeptide-type bacteriocin biosynthesis protein